MGTYNAAEGVVLSLHVAVGSGNVYSMFLGGENDWEFLITGSPFEQLGRCVALRVSTDRLSACCLPVVRSLLSTYVTDECVALSSCSQRCGPFENGRGGCVKSRVAAGQRLLRRHQDRQEDRQDRRSQGACVSADLCGTRSQLLLVLILPGFLRSSGCTAP